MSRKLPLFYAFCVRGCVASHVESDPRGYAELPCYQNNRRPILSKVTQVKTRMAFARKTSAKQGK